MTVMGMAPRQATILCPVMVRLLQLLSLIT